VIQSLRVVVETAASSESSSAPSTSKTSAGGYLWVLDCRDVLLVCSVLDAKEMASADASGRVADMEV
jgi:hypothetical protein